MIIEAPINLDLTQSSGQTSQPPWTQDKNTFKDVVIVDNKPILFKVLQTGNNLNFDYELPLNSNFEINNSLLVDKVIEVFDLNFNFDDFYRFLIDDENLAETSNFCNGLRLFIAKNKFECIISSICSANNSIKRWTKSIETIKRKWGTPYKFPSGTFYSFPEINTIKNVFKDENEEFNFSNDILDINKCNNNLKSCGVGYRASYMKKASEIFTLEIDLSDIEKMSYDEAFETILKVPGVGPKVADCILLYGYNFKEAFPSDIWIKRIVSYLYFEGKDISVNKVREFGMDQFGDYAGYVQLYLFHYARMSGLMNKLKK